MERRRLQQQRIKQQQQQRFCVSQQDLTQAIARMKPQRRATHDNLMNISSSSLSACSVETLTVPSVSELIKEYEARAISTPYVSAQDFSPIDNVVVSNGAESNCCQQMPFRTKQIKVNNNNDDDDNDISSSISSLNNDNDQTLIQKTNQDQYTRDKEQETTKKEQLHQTLNNDRYKRDLPSPSSSSYYSIESNNNNNNPIPMLMRNRSNDSSISKSPNKRFSEILTKEEQLNNALADLMSLSNDADISSSSSRSLSNISHRRRTSSINDNVNSISSSIALLNNLLETFDLDNEEYMNKTSKKNNIDRSSQKSDNAKPTNKFW
jgi:hypothetical protein